MAITAFEYAPVRYQSVFICLLRSADCKIKAGLDEVLLAGADAAQRLISNSDVWAKM